MIEFATPWYGLCLVMVLPLLALLLWLARHKVHVHLPSLMFYDEDIRTQGERNIKRWRIPKSLLCLIASILCIITALCAPAIHWNSEAGRQVVFYIDSAPAMQTQLNKTQTYTDRAQLLSQEFIKEFSLHPIVPKSKAAIVQWDPFKRRQGFLRANELARRNNAYLVIFTWHKKLFDKQWQNHIVTVGAATDNVGFTQLNIVDNQLQLTIENFSDQAQRCQLNFQHSPNHLGKKKTLPPNPTTLKFKPREIKQRAWPLTELLKQNKQSHTRLTFSLDHPDNFSADNTLSAQLSFSPMQVAIIGDAPPALEKAIRSARPNARISKLNSAPMNPKDYTLFFHGDPPPHPSFSLNANTAPSLLSTSPSNYQGNYWYNRVSPKSHTTTSISHIKSNLPNTSIKQMPWQALQSQYHINAKTKPSFNTILTHRRHPVLCIREKAGYTQVHNSLIIDQNNWAKHPSFPLMISHFLTQAAPRKLTILGRPLNTETNQGKSDSQTVRANLSQLQSIAPHHHYNLNVFFLWLALILFLLSLFFAPRKKVQA